MYKRVKIYTKTGDRGNTSLYGGKRVLKSNIRVEAYGSIDELNSLLGIIIPKISDIKTAEFIRFIQKDLFLTGSYLAGAQVKIDRLGKRIEEMEHFIDRLDKKLVPLKNFIVPDGSEASAFIFFARAVARRAERKIVALNEKERIAENILIYINRLSDLLFVLARYINSKSGYKEKVWTT